MTPEISELMRQNEENLIAFLRTDAKLASTFCKIAESTEEPEHRAKLLRDVKMAVNAIRYFGERITDPAICAELNNEADRLDGFPG